MKPWRSEADAFRLLLYVIAGAAVLIAIVLAIRALT
jgi:hypothetical protein